MTWLAVTAAAIVVLTALWLVWTATRLDRLHLKAETAEATLRECLAHRAAAAVELAATARPDPASAALLMAAASTAAARDRDAWEPESRLSETLRALELSHVPGDPDWNRLLDTVWSDDRRAAIARDVHNDVAARAQDLHGRRRVRWFRLAGRAPAAARIDFDDAG